MNELQLYVIAWKDATTLMSSEKSQKYTKKYNSDSIYIKFKNRLNQSVLLKVRILVILWSD